MIALGEVPSLRPAGVSGNEFSLNISRGFFQVANTGNFGELGATPCVPVPVSPGISWSWVTLYCRCGLLHNERGFVMMFGAVLPLIRQEQALLPQSVLTFCEEEENGRSQMAEPAVQRTQTCITTRLTASTFSSQPSALSLHLSALKPHRLDAVTRGSCLQRRCPLMDIDTDRVETESRKAWRLPLHVPWGSSRDTGCLSLSPAPPCRALRRTQDWRQVLRSCTLTPAGDTCAHTPSLREGTRFLFHFRHLELERE